MKNQNGLTEKMKLNPFIKNTWIVLVIWTAIQTFAFVRDIIITKNTINELAINEARTRFKSDASFRILAASHGGFYVPITDRTPPSPYLKYIKDQNIETPSGVKLTLLNPAYVMRQLYEKKDIIGHITSLNPLNPENKPDEWETKALINFEHGDDDFHEVIINNDEEILRFMKPLIAEKACLKCHEHQGYKIGEIRGGVGITIPFTIYSEEQHKAIMTHFYSYLIIWIIGILVILIVSNIMVKKNVSTLQLVDQLSQSNKKLIKIDKETNELLEKTDKQRIAHLVILEDLNLTTKTLQSEVERGIKKTFELTKLTTAIEQSPSIITITNTKGIIEYINPKFTKITQYESIEAIGSSTNILKSGQQSPDIFKTLWKTITNGKEWRGEFHNKKKNGELFWESASISPIRNNAGEIINFIKVSEDITEQKRNLQVQKVISNISTAVIKTNNIEEFIHLVKKEISTIVDTRNFYIALYDKKSDTFSLPFHTDVIDKFQKFPAGKSLTAYVINTKKPLLANIDTIKKLEKAGEIEIVGAESKIWLGLPLLVRDKAIGAFAVQSYSDENAYTEADMNILQIVSDQISISLERKRAEDDLKYALEKAQESDRLKSAFLSNMSHEIRTPLNGMLGFVRMLNDPDFEDDEKEMFIEVIDRSSDRLITTINDMIDISKIEAGQMEVRLSETNVNKMLHELFAFFKPQTDVKEISFMACPTLKEEQAIIKTDNDKLFGILTNLIKNAIKYTDEGNIIFGYHQKDLFIEFYVKDTGVGIPEKRKEAIFNRFEQADSGDVRAFEGAGLGLAIAKSYAEMLGGELWMTSEVGKGSEFMFTIPNKV